jgi:hypothetical protein
MKLCKVVGITRATIARVTWESDGAVSYELSGQSSDGLVQVRLDEDVATGLAQRSWVDVAAPKGAVEKSLSGPRGPVYMIGSPIVLLPTGSKTGAGTDILVADGVTSIGGISHPAVLAALQGGADAGQDGTMPF